MNIAIEWRTVKASKRHNLSNPITAAFKAIEQAIRNSQHNLTSVAEADVVFVFGSITKRKTETDRAKVVQSLRNSGKKILSIDSGLFGTYIRQHTNSAESMFFRIGYGDCTGQGDLLVKNCDDKRLSWFFNTFNFSMKERKKLEGPILFIGQSEKGWQYDELIPYEEWALDKINKIRDNTDRNIIFRVHPTDISKTKSVIHTIKNVEVTVGSRSRIGIVEDMQKCTTSVTHSSSAALESLVEGLNTVALSDRCVVHEACSDNVFKQMDWNKRFQHLCDYAYSTWHVSELSNPALIEYYMSKIQ